MRLDWISLVGSVLIAAGLCGLGLFALRVRVGYRRRQNWRRHFERHRIALTKRYRQLVHLNDYGFEEREKWLQELAKFRKSVGLSIKNTRAFETYATRLINLWVSSEDRSVARPAMDVKTPDDYEHFCADLLRRAGWVAEVTPSSGDQGVDVIAEKNGRRVALQCKMRTSSHVGNKAVQEVYAAAGFVDASVAAVVSNQDYTPAARTLANKLDVLLLHHSDLVKLFDSLDGKENESFFSRRYA